MKIKFKYQKFQADAAKAVCDVFEGQPLLSSSYMIDRGFSSESEQTNLFTKDTEIGFKNAPIIPKLNDNIILEHIQKIQRTNQIEPSNTIEGRFNLSIEMETGVGKTYTYIKTMYELHKNYGWSKFIVVVPSIAIREGVYSSFKSTQEHFAEEYGKKIKFFIYNSSRLNEIEQFANDGGLNVMIINSQAFNAINSTKKAIEEYNQAIANGENPKRLPKETRKIFMKLDGFRSRRPIDVISATNPIMIIDEPQSVEGTATKEALKMFNPLMTLRYSATHKKLYNLVYRLDAIEAYNKKLVKKISVKGVTVSGTTATNSYIYLQGINVFKDKKPTATIEFDCKTSTGITKKIKNITEGENLWFLSGELDEYKDGFTVSRIDAREEYNCIEFINGIKLSIGSAIGKINEDQIRRLQIRETILSHLKRERQLYSKGIKVLSLFFIDEVAKYKQYDDDNNEINGIYADIFEEEYEKVLASFQLEIGQDDYINHIKNITARETHAGYFSIDKKSKRIINSKEDKKEGGSNDADAFDLIMRNKERLLDMNEPVRFIFSHSALREGWDNPNVFQICTLKQSNAGDRKRQEIGRGLRLCVNQNGERMDSGKIGETVHDINILTVIANESYNKFTKALQDETAESVASRPRVVDETLFVNEVIVDDNNLETTIDIHLAKRLNNNFIRNNYVDDNGILTDKYYEDKKYDNIIVPEELKGYENSIVQILDRVYNPERYKPENANTSKPVLEIDKDKLNKKEFKELWSKINSKSAYVVNFDTEELIKKSIREINLKLNISQLFSIVEEGELNQINSKEELKAGKAFANAHKKRENINTIDCYVKYDLVGKIVEQIGLTRKTVVKILKGIRIDKFEMFKANPEDFIIKISNMINEQKATVIIEHISYNKLDEVFSSDIFTEPTLKTLTNKNITNSEKGLYNYLIYDSEVEKKFGQELDDNSEVSVYVKLPKGFYINTPVGHYNPDWAIAFNSGSVKHIYFVAETKGSMSSMQLKSIEQAKIDCARVHFKSISSNEVKYDVVNTYEALLDKVKN